MPLPRCGQCTIQDNDDNDDNDDDNGDDVDVDAVDDGATKCYTHLNKIHIYHYAQRLLSPVVVVANVIVVVVVFACVIVAVIALALVVAVAADIDNHCDGS